MDPAPLAEEFYGKDSTYARSALLPPEEDLGLRPFTLPPGWQRLDANMNLVFAGNAAWADPDFPMAPAARLTDGALTLVAVHGLGTCGLLPKVQPPSDHTATTSNHIANPATTQPPPSHHPATAVARLSF